MEAHEGREPAHAEAEFVEGGGSSIEYDNDSSAVSEADDLKNMLEAHARELTEKLKREITEHAESVAVMAEVSAPVKHKAYYSTPLTGLSASVIKDEATGLIF